MSFAEKLQSLRKENGMSQENLAEAIGVSRQAVSKWESGQSYPEIDKLIALSELFHVSLDGIIKDTESVKKESMAQENGFVNPKWKLHYEYKSRRTLFHVPLVHINIGYGVHVAKGIIAIGNISFGCVSVGILALGGICFGALSLGLLALAGIALGLLFSTGGIAVGTIAIGGVAVGIFTLGGLSVGMFSIGGCAIASHIAVGGYAKGHIAIGDTVHGVKTIVTQNHNFSSIGEDQVRTLIHQEYPNLWQPITDWMASIFG